MLLITGLITHLWIEYLGGFDMFGRISQHTDLPFRIFNEDPSYPAVDIWQDAMANSAMFYFLNQGMVMRLMAARSVDDSRKAVMTMLFGPYADCCTRCRFWLGWTGTNIC